MVLMCKIPVFTFKNPWKGSFLKLGRLWLGVWMVQVIIDKPHMNQWRSQYGTNSCMIWPVQTWLNADI